MKFNLLALLMLFIPITLFTLGTRTWFESVESGWPEFELNQLESYRGEHDHVVLYVKSAYGMPGDVWLERFLDDSRVRQAQLNQELFFTQFEFRYVTGAPAGLGDEYEWVYGQPIYVKDAFFAIYSRGRKKKLYTWHDDPVSAIESMGLVDWEYRYRMLGCMSAIGIVGFFVFSFLKRSKSHNNAVNRSTHSRGN